MQARPGMHGSLGTSPAKDDESEEAAVARLGALGGLDDLQRQAARDSSSPLARMALARARIRAVIPMDTITFVAACPACGHDCQWTQEREETRVRSYQDCPCTP